MPFYLFFFASCLVCCCLFIVGWACKTNWCMPQYQALGRWWRVHRYELMCVDRQPLLRSLPRGVSQVFVCLFFFSRERNPPFLAINIWVRLKPSTKMLLQKRHPDVSNLRVPVPVLVLKKNQKGSESCATRTHYI